MKLYFLILTLLFSFFTSFSQIEPKKKNFKKIKFKYIQRVNFRLSPEGIYADTLFWKYNFSQTKFNIVAEPLNQSKLCGFVAKENLSKKIFDDLISMIFHTSYVINGDYDVRNNATTINISFEKPDDMRNLMKKWFNKEIEFIELGVTIYNFKEKLSNYKLHNIDDFKKLETINEISFFDETKTSGYKDFPNQVDVGNVLITLNPELDKHINFGNLYSNSDYGVLEMAGINFTKKLVSVQYE